MKPAVVRVRYSASGALLSLTPRPPATAATSTHSLPDALLRLDVRHSITRRLRQADGPARGSSEPPPSLTLLLPDKLTETEYAEGVSAAFIEFRDRFIQQALYWGRQADEEDRDSTRRTHMAVKAHAFAQAVAQADEALVAVFDLRRQYVALHDAVAFPDD